MTSDVTPRISYWIPVAFGCTGFLIGFTTGLSSSPVVKELLPLIFGLIAGGAGFFATKQIRYSRVIGVSLCFLTVAAVVGIVQGIVIRDDSTWGNFWHHKSNQTITFGDLDKDNLTKYVALLALRSQLQHSNFSTDEQNKILTAAAKLDDPSIIKSVTNDLSNLDIRERYIIPTNLPNALADRPPSDRVARTEDTTGY